MHKPNVTVAMVVKCAERYLLVEERDKSTGQRVLNQPAGHLEANESLIAAAQRELLEETGLNLAPQGLVGIYSLRARNGTHYLRFCFFAELDEASETAPQDSDIIACHWLNIAQIKEQPLRSSIVLTCIDDAQNRPILPLEYLRHCQD